MALPDGLYTLSCAQSPGVVLASAEGALKLEPLQPGAASQIFSVPSESGFQPDSALFR